MLNRQKGTKLLRSKSLSRKITSKRSISLFILTRWSNIIILACMADSLSQNNHIWPPECQSAPKGQINSVREHNVSSLHPFLFINPKQEQITNKLRQRFTLVCHFHMPDWPTEDLRLCFICKSTMRENGQAELTGLEVNCHLSFLWIHKANLVALVQCLQPCHTLQGSLPQILQHSNLDHVVKITISNNDCWATKQKHQRLQEPHENGHQGVEILESILDKHKVQKANYSKSKHRKE